MMMTTLRTPALAMSPLTPTRSLFAQTFTGIDTGAITQDTGHSNGAVEVSVATHYALYSQ